MLRKQHEYRWEGVDLLRYKEQDDTFRDVTRQVLFRNAPDIPCEWRYFEVAPGGWSTLEHHEHTHWVVIFRGRGEALLGDEVVTVAAGDAVEIPAWTWHQFRANQGEELGFFCLVNSVRDKVTLPREEDRARFLANPKIRKFLEADNGEE